jgi:cyanophycinase
VPEGVTCDVQTTPIFTRSDAENPDNIAYFTDDVGAVYILGGDQTIAMQVMADTPVEAALKTAYERGALIAGTSAGEAVQSQAMIGGYVGDFGPETGLNEGAVDVWNSDDKRGLNFGITNAILEQHFWERARLGRLLNVLAQPGVPGIGLGIDSYTAATITNGKTLSNVAGLYSIGILDANWLDTGLNASFKNDILSIHDVRFHILPPGDFLFDLETHETSIAPPLMEIERTFDDLKTPAGAGTLILASNQDETISASPSLARFVELAGGENAVILLLVSADSFEGVLNPYAEALVTAGVATENIEYLYATPPGNEDQVQVENIDQFTGIVFVGNNNAIIKPETVQFLKDEWLSGKPMMLDNAAAAIAGNFYSAQGPIPEATDDEPFADIEYIQDAFIDGNTNIQPGLGLLNINVEARTLADYRVGRLVALGYAHPDTLVIGLNDDSALEINADGATVLASNGVFVLDLRQATLAKGTNDAYAFANGLLDTFAPGEQVVAAN